MKIQGALVQNNAHGHGQIKRQQQEAQVKQSNIANPSDGIKTESSTLQTPTDQINIGEAKGVIRNLQEGHYKGVAQLRLSVVHAERFQQATSQDVAKVIGSEGEMLTSSVREKIESIYTADASSEEVGAATESTVPVEVENALKEFEDTVAGQESKPTNIETFKELYSTAFQDLLVKLNDFQSANEVESPVQAAPGVQDEGDQAISEPESHATTEAGQETIEGGVGLEELQDWFYGELEKIESQITTISSPPLPNQPTGNGGAYEKFLSAYEDIYGTTGQQTVSTPSGENNTIETEV